MLRLFYLSILLSFTHISFPQTSKVSGKVTYLATIRKSLYISGSSDQTDTTWLYFNDTASSYVIDTKAVPDPKKIAASIDQWNTSPDDKKLALTSILNTFNKNRIQYTYHQNGTSTTSRPWTIGNKDCCRLDTLADFNWELQPDTMRILGFLCQKAISKSIWEGGLLRGFTAWYSPEIPVADGPKNIFGLPGLVLLADSKYYNYKAVAVKIPLPQNEIPQLYPCLGLPLIDGKQVEAESRKLRESMMNMQKLRTVGN